MNELEKMDAIKERLNVTYAEAKEALDMFDGDLAQALAYLDGKAGQQNETGKGSSAKWDKETMENFARGLIEQIKSIIKEGNVSKVRLKQGENTIIEVPATIGVVGLGVTLFSPLLLALGALGAATAVMKEMTFELERPDGTIERRQLKMKGKQPSQAEDFQDSQESQEETVEDNSEE